MVLCLKPPKPWPTQHLDVFFLFWRLQGFRFHHLLVSYQKMPMLSIAGLKFKITEQSIFLLQNESVQKHVHKHSYSTGANAYVKIIFWWLKLYSTPLAFEANSSNHPQSCYSDGSDFQRPTQRLLASYWLCHILFLHCFWTRRSLISCQCYSAISYITI